MHRGRALRVMATALVTSSVCGLACGPPGSDPAPPFGPVTVRIYQQDLLDPTIENTLWTTTVVPGATLTYGPHDLGQASLTPLAEALSERVRGSVWSPDGELARPVEAQLYPRELDLVPRYLEYVVDRDAFMAELLTPALSKTYRDDANQLLNGGNPTLPDGWSIPYPLASATGLPTDSALQNAQMENQPPLGPVVGGSIRTVRIVQNGLCATVQPMSAFAAQAAQLVVQQLQPNCAQLDLRLDWATVAPIFWHRDVDPALGGLNNPFDSRAGVAFNAGAYAHLSPIGQCFVKFSGLYEIVNNAGIAELQLRSKTVVGNDGALCRKNYFSWLSNLGPLVIVKLINVSGAEEIADATLTTGIPVSMNANIRALQTRTTLSVTPCDPTIANAPATGGDGDGCGPARQELAAGIQKGANLSGIFDVASISALVNAANRLDNGKYSNWTCTPTVGPSKPNVGVCQYVARARRLIVNPDDVRLVWFDNFKDFTNSALAFFFYIKSTQNPALLAQYCSNQSLTGPFARKFAVTQLPPFRCP